MLLCCDLVRLQPARKGAALHGATPGTGAGPPHNFWGLARGRRGGKRVGKTCWGLEKAAGEAPQSTKPLREGLERGGDDGDGATLSVL